MNTLIALIQKFQAGEATENEKRELLAALEKNDQALKIWSEINYNSDIRNNTQVISKNRSIEIYNQIQELKNIQTPVLSKPQAKLIPITKRWVQLLLTACVIGIMAIGILYFNNYQNRNNSTLVENNIPLLQRNINTTNETITIVLKDGSSILLEPQSAIAYYSPFSKKRDISLTGKATFKVAKNAAKPFTVYANGISTRALGTVFSIDAFNNKVAVRLLEGKVVVKAAGAKVAFSDTYLKPGEQWVMNNQNGIYSVSTFKNKTINSINEIAIAKMQKIKKGETKINNGLEFNKTPLSDVFTKVGNSFKTILKYEKSEIGNATFTGSFLKTDSLKSILIIICNTNDLLFREENGLIVIYK